MYHTFESKLELSASTFFVIKNTLAELSKKNRTRFYEDKNNNETNKVYYFELLKYRGIHITAASFIVNGFIRFFLILRINPKRILNNNDFISVTHESETEILYIEVNKCLSSIGIHERFENFLIERIDYCVNPRFPDENISAYYMELLKRGVLLYGFEPLLRYDDTQHRMIENENAIYARNQSIIINFYNKYPEMLARPGKYQGYLEEYRGVIRFEIQCLKPKVRSMKYYNELPDMRAFRWMKEEFSEGALLFYVKKIFCKGDFVTLSEARQRIMSENFRDNTKQMMLTLLELTNEKRSLRKALDTLYNEGIQHDYLNRILDKFDRIHVTPVTIPINWRIPRFDSPLKIVLHEIERNTPLGIGEPHFGA